MCIQDNCKYCDNIILGRIQGLEKGGSKVMYKAAKARNEMQRVGWVWEGYPPSQPFDVFLDKTVEMV